LAVLPLMLCLALCPACPLTSFRPFPVNVLCIAEPGDDVVLQFQLSKVGGHRLQLTVMDCERLYRVVTLTALGTVDPERLHTLFNTQTVDGRLHKAGFDLCIRTLVPGQALSSVDKQYVELRTGGERPMGVGIGGRVVACL
jgi:hypothetical protein